MFLYMGIMQIVLSFFLAKKIGFPYIGNITLETAMLFISSGKIVLAMLVFVFCMTVTIYGVRFITWLLATIFYAIVKAIVSDLYDMTLFQLRLFGVLDSNNKKGRHFDALLEIFHVMTNPQRGAALLSFMDFLGSLLLVSLIGYKLCNIATHLPHWVDCVLLVVMWVMLIYWILNIAVYKMVSGVIEQFRPIILNA